MICLKEIYNNYMGLSMKKQSKLFGNDENNSTLSNSNNFSNESRYNNQINQDQNPVYNYYDAVKDFNGKKYTGMRIGGKHKWHYDDGIWEETKLTPDKWELHFTSLKKRWFDAPENSGAGIGSGFHWYIIADQKAIKIDENTYKTDLMGVKYKIGHKKPNWRNWSYKYPSQMSYKEQVIRILEEILENLKNSS